MPRTKALTIFDAGLQLPAAAGAGKVLTSDASGNGTWGTAAGGALVYEQATAPATPKVGDIWVETDVDIYSGRVLDFQRIACQNAGYRTASFAGTVAYHTLERTAVAGAPYQQLSVQSDVPFFWEITANFQLIRKDDAAYNYMYAGVNISVPDSDGNSSALVILTGHSTVMHYLGANVRRTFRLPGGPGTYTVSQVLGAGDGGTWNYNKGDMTYMEARAFAQ